MEKPAQQKCTVKGCEKKYFSAKYCGMHYGRMRRNGSVHPTREKHGLSKTTEWKSWAGMKARCYNPNKVRYENYGGRGIKVCDRWKNSFLNFYDDMGPKPSADYSIDRIDVNGNYEPDNCRWANNHEQAANRTNNTQIVGVSYDAKTNRYTASLMVNGIKVLYKRYKNIQEAIKARKTAEMEYNI